MKSITCRSYVCADRKLGKKSNRNIVNITGLPSLSSGEKIDRILLHCLLRAQSITFQR